MIATANFARTMAKRLVGDIQGITVDEIELDARSNEWVVAVSFWLPAPPPKRGVAVISPTPIRRSARHAHRGENTCAPHFDEGSAVFPMRLTTPHILTEVSNHLDNIEPSLLPALRTALADWMPLRESWTPASSLVAEPEYPEIALADSAILRATGRRTIVVTADRALWAALVRRRRTALHYSDVVRH